MLDHTEPGHGWWSRAAGTSTRDGQDVYSCRLEALVGVGGRRARLVHFADLDDQVEACGRVSASDTWWTVVRGSDLKEGESQGLPVWSRHVGDPVLETDDDRLVRGDLRTSGALAAARPRISAALGGAAGRL